MNELVKFTKDGFLIDGELFTLDQIAIGCNRAKVKEDKLALLQISWKGGRGMDDIVEHKIMKAENVEPLLNLIIGQQVYFGEIAGKHSEVYGTLDTEDIAVKTDTATVVAFLLHHPSGWDSNYSFLNRLMNDDNEDESLADKVKTLIKF